MELLPSSAARVGLIRQLRREEWRENQIVLIVFQFWKSVFQERADGIAFNAVGSIEMFGDLVRDVPGPFKFCSNGFD